MAAWMYIGSTWSSFSFSSSAAAAGPRGGGGGRARLLCGGSRRDEVRGKVGGSKAPADMSLMGQAARCLGRCGRMRVRRLCGVVVEGEEMMRERSGVGGAKRTMRCSAGQVIVVGGGGEGGLIICSFQDGGRILRPQRSCLRDLQLVPHVISSS